MGPPFKRAVRRSAVMLQPPAVRLRWIIRPGKCSHRRWADAVPAHVHLLCLSEGLAVAVGDDVVACKALGLVQFGRLQHPQADVDDQ